MKVLEQDRLPCMVRSTVTGERKLIEAMAWRDQIELLWSRRDGLLVVHRRHPREPDANIVKPFRGGRFFVWQLALDRLWPPPAGRAPVEHADASDAPSRVKPGPKPQDDWPTLIAQWLIEVAVDDPKRLQNVDALVIEAKLFLHNQTGRAPKENKELRDKIRELLERVRR
ncbi:hypothetical protein [Bradyrhizobium septentrionale]|uniref:Uncharacterized protein n=1 Tax=Bradyrhizobium septentrionale TaxID=1404411 RepID=A0ABZ2NSK9_9BRAD